MAYDDRSRHADLMRQGFMRPLKTRAPKQALPTIACADCLNWHRQGKHTSPPEVRRQRREERRAQEKARKHRV